MKFEHEIRIFIVDDDPFTRELYHQHLINLGYKDIHVLENGAVCLNCLPLEPNVIFLDYNTGGINGLELIQIIKRVNPGIYVVLVSGHENLMVVADSLHQSAFDYIVKGDTDTGRIEEILGKIHSIQRFLVQLPENTGHNGANALGRIFKKTETPGSVPDSATKQIY